MQSINGELYIWRQSFQDQHGYKYMVAHVNQYLIGGNP